MDNKVKKFKKTKEEIAEEKFKKKLVEEVKSDFARRRKERLNLERQWELNMNFFIGNQNSAFSPKGELAETDKDFYWQNREIFNHITPLVESRLAKLSRIEPILTVKPASPDDNEIENAYLAEKILHSTFDKMDVTKKIADTTLWSEICGTGFYKVIWDNNGGKKIGKTPDGDVFEGDVKIISVSPFEIFPDSLYNVGIENCKSIIHAKVMDADEVFEIYKKRIPGEEVDVFSLSNVSQTSREKSFTSKKSDGVIVIEKYEKPTSEFKKGRLITVAGNELLYYGELPYVNGDNGTFTFPFIKQVSLKVAGCFFGASVIERLIPVQRAFNAVKNRKHEFLNRLAMGVMTVEDGSVDTDELAEEGLCPGKVIVYRQGTSAPKMLEEGSIPNDFNTEEEKLLNEFVIISGVSDVVSSTQNANVNSGTALEILIEQDNERMVVTADAIRKCVVEMAKHVLRLYRQFLTGVRIISDVDNDSKMKLFYIEKGIISSDDISIANENELFYTPRQKKEMLLNLYKSGILNDSTGKLRAETKEKLLSLLGYSHLDQEGNLLKLHEEKAKNENVKIKSKGLSIDEIDEHQTHIDEHLRYFLSEHENLSQDEKIRISEHIKAHKRQLKEEETK